MKKGMVDIVGGKMTLKELNHEIINQMLAYKKVNRLIVDIKRRKDGYYATLWISEKDFLTKKKI